MVFEARYFVMCELKFICYEFKFVLMMSKKMYSETENQMHNASKGDEFRRGPMSSQLLPRHRHSLTRIRLQLLLSQDLALLYQSRSNPRSPRLPIDGQLIQESPPTLLLPPFLLPPIDRPRRKTIHDGKQSPVMGHADKHILIRVKLL